ncbi:hypothetical protein ACP70R_038802 [Stipagrostis hirtigluma subsp. patula]
MARGGARATLAAALLVLAVILTPEAATTATAIAKTRPSGPVTFCTGALSCSSVAGSEGTFRGTNLHPKGLDGENWGKLMAGCCRLLEYINQRCKCLTLNAVDGDKLSTFLKPLQWQEERDERQKMLQRKAEFDKDTKACKWIVEKKALDQCKANATATAPARA